MLLSVLNTNVHIYQTSPSLTIIEKTTSRSLAHLFGLSGPRAGGITCPGGSASNLTSLITARNSLFPETKTQGNSGYNFAIFTSKHGHYSVEKAAVATGLGSANVITIPVDAEGRMVVPLLEDAISDAKNKGLTPLYVNATAGSTVLGSFDPFVEIADVCNRHKVWMHVDASWGGGVVFSNKQKHKLEGVERADSITFNPHKMLNVPVVCSFLLTADLSVFKRANTLPARYLFHGDDDNDEDGDNSKKSNEVDGVGNAEGKEQEYWDLADLTLQCGRRGDSLKLALSWIYYGSSGFASRIDHAYDMAAYLASRIDASKSFALLSTNPPPCLQVCFYYIPGADAGAAAGGENGGGGGDSNSGDSRGAGSNKRTSEDANANTRNTKVMVKNLVARGFMVDYAPGEKGSFFRVVVNCQTRRETIDGLFSALEEVGAEVIASGQGSASS
ncbi:pyridoxal phosphate-dependent transferase [Xylariaceae sp. FL0255]|nr:pyridoxal phosphate-dependent transferase [Xylariaceae sp. FL0255]